MKGLRFIIISLILLLIFGLLMLFTPGCAASQKRQEPTMFMNHQARIQYYQEQIVRYNYLIDQEKKKIEAEKIKQWRNFNLTVILIIGKEFPKIPFCS